MEYLDQLEGILGEEERYPMPELFKMEMLALGERMLELEMAATPEERAQFESRIRELMGRQFLEVVADIADYARGKATTAQIGLLKGYYVKQKYCLRIMERLSTFASRDQVF
ncbi:hypothetical protein ACFOTA_18005 [Chitinophaga sp. GCM10012297]|uniref:Co-chaperone HscB C-terminal oligomerisation domain-containing protein n=1 Tax=Chitinophaga chungangae TaxID=2821488 RepID=A0ABS3YHF7_9BACT|nr:hypothetical protein [Chitinophaga chungangae]MBO9154116.1 hypothetical protein [Chitinophaga chungangae]